MAPNHNQSKERPNNWRFFKLKATTCSGLSMDYLAGSVTD